MKISEKDGLSTKTVYFDPEEFQLLYKRGFPRRGNQTIDLTEIIHFGWGKNSRAFVVGVKKQLLLKPWLAFSLYSKSRSFDFIIPEGRDEERDLQIMILALSALCPNCSGLVQTRGKFILKKALMKIDEQCKWKGVTRAQLVYAALERTAVEEGIALPAGGKDKLGGKNSLKDDARSSKKKTTVR